MGKGKIKILLCCFMSVLLFSTYVMHVNAENLYVERKADVVFVIDATGSMGGCISSVKANITNFINLISKEDVDIRVKFVIYRDITCSEPTYASEWYNSTGTSSSYLTSVDATGGGDGPETLLDGMGMMLSSGFRADAVKYCVAFTDAETKTENNYGYTMEEAVISDINSAGINMSVVTDSSLFEGYDKYVSKDNGGILADIYGDYSILLRGLADTIIEELDGLGSLVMVPRNCKEGEDVTVRVTSKVTGGIKYADDFAVLFDGENAEIVSKEADYFEFKVPVTKQLGKYEVKTINGAAESLVGHFTIESAAQYGVMAPSSTIKGTAVTVKVPVSKLHYLPDFTIKAGGRKMSVSSKNDDYFEFVIPSDLDVNSYDITLTNGGQVEYLGEFAVNPKSVTFGEMTPTETQVGTGVSIKIPCENIEYGPDFKAYINDTEAKVTKFASYFKVSVPSTTPVGEYNISVTNYKTNYSIGVFKVNEIPPIIPAIGTISPNEGEANVSTSVKVPVENMSYADDFTVSMNGRVLKSTKFGSYFKFTVPSDMEVGSYPVTLVNGGNTYELGTYTVKAKVEPLPVIGVMDKTEGEEGESVGVKVSVENMSYADDFAVSMNGRVLKSTKFGSYFKFTVPSDMEVGSYPVTLVNGGNAYELGTYTVKAKVEPLPVIGAMDKTEGEEGESVGVKVSVENMSYADDFAVSMNGRVLKSTKFGSYFKFTVPSDMEVGSYPVTLVNGGNIYELGTYTVNAKVEPIPTFEMQTTESSAGVNKSVKVLITDFSYGPDCSVSVGTTKVKMTKFAKYFKFTVPSTMPAGTYEVTVTNNGNTYDIGTYTLK